MSRKNRAQQVMTDEQKPVLDLDFSQLKEATDLKFSAETPSPYIFTTDNPTISDNYYIERAQEFLSKFDDFPLLPQKEDKQKFIVEVIRNLVYSPDLLDLDEIDLIDLADTISQL